MSEKKEVTVVNNYIDGRWVPPAGAVGKDGDEGLDSNNHNYLDVVRPQDGIVIGRVAVSSKDDVDSAVTAAQTAFPAWSALTIKARAAIMLKFHALVRDHANELAELIVSENGKNINEALADVAKGNETVEYACSLPQLAQGNQLQVSSGGVWCRDERRPLGVIASIVPFNFPFMVPMWTLPIAMVMGNTVVLKPSEKVPLTMHRVADLIAEAGFPPGVFNLVQGTRTAVESLIEHPHVKAVTFVGSSPVAELVSSKCRSLHKRCTALGGAKNHLVALPDCHVDTAASDITVSFAGCAGQRCMAASVLLLVGGGQQPSDLQQQSYDLLVLIRYKALQIKPGNGPGEMGPVIDEAAYQKIISYIEDSVENDGAEVFLDGRESPWSDRNSSENGGGHWIGPTILRHKSAKDRAVREEVFGPVLSVYECSSWDEAIEIENANPFGNAASVYTTNGGHAEWFTSRFRAAMLGVNIGIPVPREPFSFGGLYGTKSKFGDMDITGDAAIEFFSNRIKITSKWPPVVTNNTTMSSSSANGAAAAAAAAEAGGAKRKAADIDDSNKHGTDANDHANFAGSM